MMMSTVSNKHIAFIQKLVKNGVISEKIIADVLANIDRADFTQNDPYVDSPQYIGYSVTISAPHMHIYAMELLKDHLSKAKKSLDVGSGSGYLTLAFAKMMNNPDSVSYGIEHIP